MIKRILCWLGWHDVRNEISVEPLVTRSGRYVFIDAKINATRKCCRCWKDF